MNSKQSSVTSNGTRRRASPATADVVGTAILAAVGATALVMGLGYGFMRDEGRIGPGFLPALTGAFILLASAAEIARLYFASGQRSGSLMDVAETAEEEAKAAIADAAKTADDRDTFGRTGTQRNRAILKVFLLLFAAILIVPLTGLLIALSLMVLAIMLWVEKKPLLPSLLVSAGGLAMMYIIFVQILGVPLPSGSLGLI